MSKLLVDINVWIDIAARSETFPDSIKFFRESSQSSHSLYFPLSGYTTVYYVLSQLLGKKSARFFMTEIQLRSTKLLAFGAQEVAIAQSFVDIKDHEDACISATALTSKSDFIVTRNAKDFKSSPIKALTPKQVLNWGNIK